MNTAKKETAVGAVVVVLGSLFLAYTSGGEADRKLDDESGYRVVAQFNRTDGLGTGGAVRLGGMPVGVIEKQVLTEDFHALVTMKIHTGVLLPKDTAALIHSDGLLGAKYIELQPGGEERMLAPDARLIYTQDAVIVDDLLARILSQAKIKRAQAAEEKKAACPEPAATGTIVEGVEGGEHEPKPD